MMSCLECIVSFAPVKNGHIKYHTDVDILPKLWYDRHRIWINPQRIYRKANVGIKAIALALYYDEELDGILQGKSSAFAIGCLNEAVSNGAERRKKDRV